MLRGQLFNATKRDQGGTGANQHKQKGHNEPSAATAETIAAQTGVSPATVKRDAKFAKAAEEIGAVAGIMAGTDKLTRKEIVAAAAQNGGRSTGEGAPLPHPPAHAAQPAPR